MSYFGNIKSINAHIKKKKTFTKILPIGKYLWNFAENEILEIYIKD